MTPYTHKENGEFALAPSQEKCKGKVADSFHYFQSLLYLRKTFLSDDIQVMLSRDRQMPLYGRWTYFLPPFSCARAWSATTKYVTSFLLGVFLRPQTFCRFLSPPPPPPYPLPLPHLHLHPPCPLSHTLNLIRISRGSLRRTVSILFVV